MFEVLCRYNLAYPPQDVRRQTRRGMPSTLLDTDDARELIDRPIWMGTFRLDGVPFLRRQVSAADLLRQEMVDSASYS